MLFLQGVSNWNPSPVKGITTGEYFFQGIEHHKIKKGISMNNEERIIIPHCFQLLLYSGYEF
jgi:hypothetical protein